MLLCTPSFPPGPAWCAHLLRESRRAPGLGRNAETSRGGGMGLQVSSPVGESLRPVALRTCTWVTCWG